MNNNFTAVPQPDKTEAVRSVLLNVPSHNQKMYRDKVHHDHLHGRVNKFPIGSSHGPIPF